MVRLIVSAHRTSTSLQVPTVDKLGLNAASMPYQHLSGGGVSMASSLNNSGGASASELAANLATSRVIIPNALAAHQVHTSLSLHSARGVPVTYYVLCM